MDTNNSLNIQKILDPFLARLTGLEKLFDEKRVKNLVTLSL